MSSTTRRTAGGLAGVLLMAVGALTACGASVGSPFAQHCGNGTRSSDVTPTIQCFGRAIARQDAQQSCALLTRRARAQAARAAIVGSGPATCVTATRRAFALLDEDKTAGDNLALFATNLEVSDVSVHGTTATATISLRRHGDLRANPEPMTLRVEDGGWKLDIKAPAAPR